MDWRHPTLFLAFSAVLAAAAPPFRTDADGPLNVKAERDGKPLEWYSLQTGQFPPEGSAHQVSGELIAIDHLERRFQLRVDRNDSQDRAVWDLPLSSAMLPYGSIWLHGAPAALQDIPLGTHLHGQFYLKAKDDDTPLPETWYRRKTPEWEFRRCFRLEDDFSFNTRQKTLWRIQKVDLEARKLTAEPVQNGKAQAAPKEFDLLPSTQVWLGMGFAELGTLQPNQEVRFNLTWVTLYGPGRITDVWVDEIARRAATARQIERHRLHIRERGLPGWVTAVDDAEETVTVTFFGGIDPLLFTEWQEQKIGSGQLAVARESLMTYDPVNDKKGARILEVKKEPVQPGSSGWSIRLKMDLMLEGFRPHRIVRFYPSNWKVIALPKEEEFFGRE